MVETIWLTFKCKISPLSLMVSFTQLSLRFEQSKPNVEYFSSCHFCVYVSDKNIISFDYYYYYGRRRDNSKVDCNAAQKLELIRILSLHFSRLGCITNIISRFSELDFVYCSTHLFWFSQRNEFIPRIPLANITTKMLIKYSLIFFLSVNLRHIESTCAPKMVKEFVYPNARRDESVVDDYHGTKVK